MCVNTNGPVDRLLLAPDKKSIFISSIRNIESNRNIYNIALSKIKTSNYRVKILNRNTGSDNNIIKTMIFKEHSWWKVVFFKFIMP